MSEVHLYPLQTSGDWLAAGAAFAFEDSYGQMDGRVLLWKRNASGVWVPKQVLQTQGAAPANNSFGYRLAMDGKRLLVGTYESSPYLDAYVLTNGQWLPDGRLTLQGKDYSGGSFGQGYGAAIAISGDTAVVGVHGGTVAGQPTAGWVDVYQRVASGWAHKARLSEPEAGTYYFGYHVAIKDGKIFVGSYQQNLPEDNGETVGSLISIYEKSGAHWVKTQSLPVPGNPRWGIISWPIVAGNRLIARSFESHYEYSLRSPYQFLGQLGTDVPNPSYGWDVLGDVMAERSRSSMEVALHRRQADQTWSVDQTFDNSVHGMDMIYVLKLTSRELMVLGDPQDGDKNTISIISTSVPPQMDHSGTVSAVTQDGDVTRLDAGEHLASATVPSLVTLSAYQPDAGSGVLEVAATGDTADFSLSATSLNLQPDKSAHLQVGLNSGTAGEKSITLTFTVQGQATPIRTYEITASRVAAATPLQFVQEPKPALCQPREVVAMSVEVEGTRPYTYRWLKDGQIIPGATSSTLWSKAGGSYQVEVTNPSGTILSTPVSQVIYNWEKPNLVTVPGGSGELSLSISGPGAEIQWEHDGLPLSDGSDYSGVNGPVLTVNNVQEYLELHAHITLESGGTTLEASPRFQVSPSVLNEGEIPWSEMDSPDAPFLKVGTRTEFTYILSVPATYTFANLPPGLQGSASGVVTGVPKKAGAFNTLVTASFGGVTVERISRLTVQGVGPAAGIYFGWLDAREELPHGGSVTLDVQASGAFTGIVQVGPSRTPITGVLPGEGAGASAPTPISGTPYVGWLQANGSPKWFSVKFREASLPASASFEVGAVMLIRAHGPQITAPEAGKYTVGLLNEGSEEVLGSGYATMNISKKGAASYVGKLADGSAIIGSSWMSDTYVEQDFIPRMYVYQWTQGSEGFLRGYAGVNRDYYEANGFLEWIRLPAPGRVYPDGFSTAVGFAASRYAKPAPAPVIPGDAHQISFQSLEATLDPTAFELTNQNKANFGAGPANPLKTKLNINANTGLFTGEFTLKDPDPAGGPGQITRKVTYSGVVLPGYANGVGHYLLPTLPDPNAEPPTTLSTSLIISGSVLIEAAP
ncbi:hypothetical protein BGE01nite_52360 [Brevifollis gellanilyticus]|uniref:Ig-like domain-containing protein n=2 Tax=Brevifollis gellanilyticus TaxID=748831 RepID=A0A512MGT4_9BACT|nr:hypothetical protein BGE01nite_52360 [Brevifollis gellanilyticus]